MSPEIGQLLLTLSMAAAFVQTLVGMGLIKQPLSLQNRLMMNIVAIHAIGLFSAMICLGYSFITDDFSVLNVALNSHTDLPVQYKVAAIWGAHEGSLLPIGTYYYIINLNNDSDPISGPITIVR